MNIIIKKPSILIVYGPTGVGKTDLVLSLAEHVPAEIINIDVGQFYTPLSIGTAKPDWRASSIPHHLFDILDEPRNCTVNEYRTLLSTIIQDVIDRDKLPILVGGSGFYLRSILFPPHPYEHAPVNISELYAPDADLWQALYAIDPQRALAIDKADTYRIERALGIWHATGKLPTSFIPQYNPLAEFKIIFLDRDRTQLNERINARVIEMMQNGWIEETEKLIGTAWEKFISSKKLIGYNEIVEFLQGDRSLQSYERMIYVIQNKTRQYAKRQRTFWRKLEREIQQKNGGCIETINMTRNEESNEKVRIEI